MKKYIAYAIASGLLLAGGWPSHGFPLLLFFGFVPLMLAEHQITQRAQYKKKWMKVFFATKRATRHRVVGRG